MVLVTAWEVVRSIGSQINFSAAERVSTLRLQEEVPQIGPPGKQGLFKGQTMGELRDEVITGLGRSFGQAHQIALAAALLENILHHAKVHPKLFDMRQTGLPRLSMPAIDELRPVLFGAAQFEKRLVSALCAGKFRNYPRHGQAQLIGLSLDDWTSHPSDHVTVRNLAFLPEEIQLLLSEADVPFGPMQNAFTGETIERFGVDVRTGNTLSSESGIDITTDSPPLNAPALELVPMERSERASGDRVTEQPSLKLSGGNRTPRRFTNDQLDNFGRQNKDGKPWKMIAAELGMKPQTLEGHMTAHRKRIEAEKEAQAAPANMFNQLGKRGQEKPG